MSKLSKFAGYAWFVLVFNLGVIIWGAYVRASGSGAGCGSHWPLCNGLVIPQKPEIATLIEYSHRLSSGLAFIFVLWMFRWSLRSYPKHHLVRQGSLYSLVFICTEALVGAGLVLFEWVAQDASVGRVISISVHLINTFLLLAALSLTAWWASGNILSFNNIRGTHFWLYLLGLIGLILIGISGAITALGDTLFPVQSLIEGVQQDFSKTAHFIIRLRIWHPLIAFLTSIYIILMTLLSSTGNEKKTKKYIIVILCSFIIIQLIAGLINVFLLAPIWLQLIHLLLADIIWILIILFTTTE